MSLINYIPPTATGRHVNEENPLGFVYIRGDENTEGSLRVIPDIAGGTEMEVQRRASGVWNDTGIQIASSTVHLGRELLISAAGEFIFTRDDGENTKALVPHVEFTTASGTSTHAHVPILAPLIANEAIQPDDSVEALKTSHTYSWTPDSNELIWQMHVEVGVSGATAPVTLTMYRGANDSGAVFFTQNYPASDFVASGRTVKRMGGLPETFANQSIYVKYESAQPFSLRGNASGDMYLSHCYHNTVNHHIVTGEVGFDKILVDAQGEIIIDESGNIVTEAYP